MDMLSLHILWFNSSGYSIMFHWYFCSVFYVLPSAGATVLFHSLYTSSFLNLLFSDLMLCPSIPFNLGNFRVSMATSHLPTVVVLVESILVLLSHIVSVIHSCLREQSYYYLIHHVIICIGGQSGLKFLKV